MPSRTGVMHVVMAGLVTTSAMAAEANPAQAEVLQLQVTIDAGKVLRTFEPRRLGGTNIAAWTSADAYASPAVRQRMKDLWAAEIRLPGGSWSNVMYWNGHGVRGADGKVDPSRMGPDEYPAVDYSDYAPSFLVDSNTLHPSNSGWHGHTDVKGLHEFIAAIGSAPFPCPNLGTGRAVDAAEWVKWANKKMGYNARYWELGNELGGGWEAGTMLPHGKGKLTGDMYGQRYREMASAMKAVDPTIRIGGGAFHEDMLRQGGDTVDFVMCHVYPGNPSYDDARQFGTVREVSRMAGVLRADIQRIQPDRADKIELAITEWGMPDYRGMRELINGLWSSLFLREAALSGYGFATQWLWNDMFEWTPKADGKDVDYRAPNQPWSQYWGLWMWNHYTANQIVSSEQTGAPPVYSFVTRGEDGVTVQLVNTDHDREAVVRLDLKGFEAANRGEMAIFSAQQYFWNPLSKKTQWSQGPAVAAIDVGTRMQVNVAPFSVVYVRIPEKANAEPSLWARWAEPTPATAGDPVELQVLLQNEGYAGDRIEGWVRAVSAKTHAPVSLADAELKVTGGTADRSTVRLKESAGRFFLTARDPGTVKVSVTANQQTVSREMIARASVPQPRIYWFFQEPELKDGYYSEWKLSTDDTIRPNQRVARIDLGERRSENEPHTLLRLDRFPEAKELNRANIRGIVFDLKVSDDFACDDPGARVDLIMQSPANYWMVIGSVPLATAQQWQTYQVMTRDAKLVEAMPYVFNVQFRLDANKPARGAVFIDRTGFMVR